MENYLVQESQKYKGQYVTMCSPDSKKVISASVSPEEAYRKAQDSGCENPILLFIPNEENSTFIY